MQCAYCGETAFHTLKNGKLCCQTHYTKCAANRQKNSSGTAKAHAEGRMRHDHLAIGGRRDWSKGKTTYSDPRVARKHHDPFSEHSTMSTAGVKNIIVKENIFSYLCVKCGNDGHWENESIVLELDHINGNNKDHRLENLRFLCPNCHSQTTTYRGRNTPREMTISDGEMLKALQTNPNVRQALRSLGLGGGGNYKRAYRLLDRET